MPTNREQLYTVTFKKNVESNEYFSRIEQKGVRGGTNIETPMGAENGLLDHIEEIKDRLEILLLNNKVNRK